MAGWHFYFLGKLLLHVVGRLQLNALADALLLCFVVFPLPSMPESRARRWRRGRAAAAGVAAAALAWHESWLPPPMTVVHFIADADLRPSLGYALDFLARTADWRLAAGAAALGGAILGASRSGLSLTPLLILGLAAVAVNDASRRPFGPAGSALEGFRASEAARIVRLPSVAAEPDFDVIIVHVCSLSWDDLRVSGFSGDPFLGSFHVLLTRFNSAASYSNPAALRLLRAPCGQGPHDALYGPAAPDCYLLDVLRRRGFVSWAAANHDGAYARMGEELRAGAHADAPLPLDGLPAPKLNFNAAPVYDDGAVLDRWWQVRQRSGAKRAVLYYNTVSLHQGVHRPGQADAWRQDRMRAYRDSAGALFGDLRRFFAAIESSRRRAVIFFVAEHGAALEGSSIQVPDLRDIPLPALTLVPSAVMFLGPGAPPAARALWPRPASYLALTELLGRLLERSPFGRSALPVDAYLRGLPETTFLAENENALVLEDRGRYLMRSNRGGWKELPSDAARDATP
ncbi:MAG: cellulose biosynthesis protein BcsG [Elusimicrobia bacterium]|nr:cellulose biosynthesis protein BcsG [Elusimicrobiota bacterium]